MSLNFGHNVLIVGPGPIGAMLGAPLVKAGYDVTFAGRSSSPHTHYIQEHGLKIRYPSGDIFTISPQQKNVQFTDTVSKLNCKFNLIIAAVKSNNLLNVSPYIHEHSDCDSILIHAQNGIPYWWFNDYRYMSQLGKNVLNQIRDRQYLETVDPAGQIFDLLGDRHIIGCVIKAPSSKLNLGSIDVKKPPKVILGLTNIQAYEEVDLVKLSEFCDQLTQNGLWTQHSTNIRAEICKKLSVNISTNTLAALTSKITASLTGNPLFKKLIVYMLEEANKIFKAFNIYEQDLPTQQELFTYLTDPGSQKHLPSMAQDFCKRQVGELNLIAAPVEMAKIAGIKTPVLESVLELLKAGQDYVLKGHQADTNLIQVNSQGAMLTLNPNVFRSPILKTFRVANLLGHIDTLNFVCDASTVPQILRRSVQTVSTRSRFLLPKPSKAKLARQLLSAPRR
jgi:2-dehydropantoate 2-reductase